MHRTIHTHTEPAKDTQMQEGEKQSQGLAQTHISNVTVGSGGAVTTEIQFAATVPTLCLPLADLQRL